MSELTRHARVRMQQRGIDQLMLESLLMYGASTHDHHGGTIVYFDKQARRRLRRDSGRTEYSALEKRLNAYAVVSNDGSVVTVGRRDKRIPRR